MLARHRRFLALLLIFIATSAVFQAAFPAFEGSDEILHFNYAEFLRSENRLPDRATRDTNSTQQSSGQPPFAYWVASLALRLFDAPRIDTDAMLHHADVTVHNRWFTLHEWWNRADNHNVYYHGRGEIAFAWDEAVAALRIARLPALLFGALTLVGLYGAAREVFRRESWALAAAAFAFMPTMVQLSAYVTNDSAAVAFSALVVWRTLALMRRGATVRELLQIGGLLGLGALSKVNVLLIAPGVAVSLLFDAYNRRASLRQLITNGLILAAPFALIFLPWMIYGALTYGDPFGFNTHRHLTENFFFDQPRSLIDVARELPRTYLSFWALLGNVPMRPATYTAFSAIAMLSLMGYALARPRVGWRRLPAQRAIVLAIMAIAVFAGMVRWMQQLTFTGGRLMYPALVPVALGVTGGVYWLGRRFPRLDLILRAFPAVTLVTSSLILAPLALRHAFGEPPRLTRDQLPALEGTPIDFEDTIRLLGYSQPDPVIDAEFHVVTLCWEVLQATDRPAAFTIKLIRDGVIAADRTSVLGMGRFNSVLWRPGDIFCDRVSMPIDDPDLIDEPPLEPATVYDLLVTLIDAETLESNWAAAAPDGTPIPIPFIGTAISPAGDMSATIDADLTPTAISFPNFADLPGVAVTGDLLPGEMVELSLLWDVTGTTPEAWSQFIHLIGGDGGAWVLADGEPRGGRYPTWAWAQGERVADRWRLTLPADLPPGDYTIKIGFYNRETGARMPVVQDGASVPDSAAVLLSFTASSQSMLQAPDGQSARRFLTLAPPSRP